jgi:carbon monoxide dehydrogenase subunit G
MEMNGTRVIAADRATVWAHLNNPETLMASVPGCKELAGSPDDGFDAVVVQKVGPVKATFKGRVELSNVIEAESYTITGQGKGGVAGYASGGADVTLTDVEGGTELTYAVTAKVGGKIAQLGNRLIAGFARKMADKFFENFQNVVEDTPDDPPET